MTVFYREFLRVLFRKRVPLRHPVVLIWMALLAYLPVFASDPSRLETSVRPLVQMLELHLDPAQEGYRGAVRVQLEFAVATNRFRFHAEDLSLGKATIDGQEVKLTVEDAGLVSAEAPSSISPGIHSFEIGISG